MHDNEQFVDEDTYFAVREEQLVSKLERSGHTRRQILRNGAAGALLLAAAGRLATAGRARAATTTTTTSPIVKPLPPEWFINYGTNAEMRWDSVAGLGYLTPNERFFVRDHTSTPLIDAGTWSLSLWGDGLRGEPTQTSPITINYKQLRRLPSVEIPAFVECPETGAASSPASRARRRAARSGVSARSASPNGEGCRLPTCSSEPGSSETRST